MSTDDAPEDGGMEEGLAWEDWFAEWWLQQSWPFDVILYVRQASEPSFVAGARWQAARHEGAAERLAKVAVTWQAAWRAFYEAESPDGMATEEQTALFNQGMRTNADLDDAINAYRAIQTGDSNGHHSEKKA